MVSDLQHKDDRWLRMEVEYLTIGGSNILAVVQRLVNKTDAPQGVQAGMGIWLAVGGTVADNVLYYEQDRPRYEQAASTDEQVRVLRHRRQDEYPFQAHWGRWAAVENPQTGDVVTLFTSHPNAWLVPEDEGKEGVNLQTGVWVSLEPNEAKEAIWWLVLCRSVAQAQAYRALGEVVELP